MESGTNRRLRLGVAGVLLALVITVIVQVVLLRANTTATAAEAYGIAVGFGLAMPLLQAASRSESPDSRATGRRASPLIALGSLAVAVVAVSVLLSQQVSGNLTVAGGAAGAYIGGMLVRAWLVRDEKDDESASNQLTEGTGDADAETEVEQSSKPDSK